MKNQYNPYGEKNFRINIDSIDGLERKPLTTDEQAVLKALCLGKKNVRDLDQFSDIYLADEIKHDQLTVQELRKNARFGKTERGEILEAILSDRIDLAEWLGNCHVHLATRYDDFINGFDMIVEWEDGTKLVLDTTVTSVSEVIAKKTKKLVDGMLRKNGTTAKYFQSEFNNQEYGPQSYLPKAIINVDKDSLQNLCELYNRAIKGEKGIESKFACHKIQFELIKCIEEQMKQELEILLSHDKSEKNPLVINIKKVLNVLDQVKKEKGSNNEVETFKSVAAVNLL